MIYQTKTTFSDRSIKIFPENVGIGYDRLLSITLAPRWTSHMQKFINDGVIDRYFGPHDYVTSTLKVLCFMSKSCFTLKADY
jgi:hypothetical protein